MKTNLKKLLQEARAKLRLEASPENIENHDKIFEKLHGETWEDAVTEAEASGHPGVFTRVPGLSVETTAGHYVYPHYRDHSAFYREPKTN